jgi:hypothetical protein
MTVHRPEAATDEVGVKRTDLIQYLTIVERT